MIMSFLDAQCAGKPTAYERALAELLAGRKQGHWIWFVLPQLGHGGAQAIAVMAQQLQLSGDD